MPASEEESRGLVLTKRNLNIERLKEKSLRVKHQFSCQAHFVVIFPARAMQPKLLDMLLIAGLQDSQSQTIGSGQDSAPCRYIFFVGLTNIH